MKLTDKLEFIKNKPARNRIILPPMDTLMANDGFANEFHIQHYGSKAYGGIGTIIVESTAVSSEGKIRSKDLGIWKDEHITGLSSIAKVIKMGGALAGIQLNHAGAKAEMASENRFGTTMRYDYLPQETLKLITLAQIKEVEDKFVAAAHRAKKAGFDFVELHGAHGYLLNELMHKDLNEVIKSDDILVRGAAILNIARRINQEVGIPFGIRISATDHVEGGMNPIDYKPMINALEKYISFINVSSGETLSRVRSDELIKVAGTKLFRIPVAKQVKEFTNKPLFIAGNISSREDVEEILAAGIDGVLIGREMIWDPSWVLHNLELSEIDKDLYHWNENIWYQPHSYLELMKMLKLK